MRVINVQSVKCVASAGSCSACSVKGYSSVMRWMLVEVLWCAKWNIVRENK